MTHLNIVIWPCGEIGRHNGLKIHRTYHPYRFEPGQGYHICDISLTVELLPSKQMVPVRFWYIAPFIFSSKDVKILMFRHTYYSCEETCGHKHWCGNIHCSANPKYAGNRKKTEKKEQTEKANEK